MTVAPRLAKVAPEATAGEHRRVPRVSPAAIGLAVALLLIVLAMAVPAILHWDVRIGFPPIYAHWMPRLGPGTVSAVGIGVLGLVYADLMARRLSWPWLLGLAWVVSLGWLLSLALVDGSSGISSQLDTDDYLQVAREPVGIGQLLHGFVDRIPLGPHHLPTHAAGHPPGAVLPFILLVRLGLDGSQTVGLIVTLFASTIPLAVMTTVRILGAERAARLAAPYLVLAPAAIWESVSGDAVFAAVGCWGLAALAAGAVSGRIGWSLLAGLLLGCTVMMSYGLPLLGFMAIAVLMAAGSLRPLAPAVLAALAVVLAFALAGFRLWDAYPALHQRYWAGVASERPAAYWLWGNLAALCISAGPLIGASLACWMSRLRGPRFDPPDVLGARAVTLLVSGAVAATIAADASLMSKAEVERIWLPFVPWLLLSCVFLPKSWRRPGLAIQVVAALAVQHLLVTGW